MGKGEERQRRREKIHSKKDRMVDRVSKEKKVKKGRDGIEEKRKEEMGKRRRGRQGEKRK